MGTLTIPLSDGLRVELQSRARDAGFASLEEYAQAVLQASAEMEMSDEEMENLLVRRSQDPRPGIEFTPAFVGQFWNDIERRRNAARTKG